MLQVQHIHKEYRTGDLVQKALDDVSLNLRDNEFVAILGPSGSGKTTLLNIIGGLDRYDSGDLIINGISTKKYKGRDWDSYRNHTVGFVFQSYNLIPHQSLLSNVELALTISGVGRMERRKRAKKALEDVGLGDQMHKKPNQLSGGQMQRVAVARALVNNPDILLADEPTGALDTETSIQIMNLLKEVAKDRLVVMVTHNPDLANEYANRIVRLQDGKIRADSNPFTVQTPADAAPVHKKMGRSSMSFLTSVFLSFNNLLTKKARTILTAFAGSIGIIGIALILSLSTGVNDYIEQIEEDTLSGYPVQITKTGFDFSSLLSDTFAGGDDEEEEGEDDEIETVNVITMLTSMFSRLDSNDLSSLKEYIESGESGLDDYTKAIEYIYTISPQIFLYDGGSDYRQVNPDSSFAAMGFGGSSNSLMSSMMSTDVFFQLPETESLYDGQYDLLAGRWPENYNEMVLVLSSSGSINDFLLYSLGLRDGAELDEMIQSFVDEEEVEAPTDIGTYTYDDIIGITYKLVNACDYYEYDEQYEVWTDKSDNSSFMRQLLDDGEDLTIVGVIQPGEDSSGILSSGIYYPPTLIDHLEEKAQESGVVKDQLANPHTNVLTGEAFSEGADQSSLFDMDSLLDMDEDSFAELFSFDEDDMQDALTDSLDFSDAFSLDLDSVDMSSLDTSAFDMSDLFNMDTAADSSDTSTDLSSLSEMSLDTSAIDMDALSDGLISGYSLYLAQNPDAVDFSDMTAYFNDYLQSDSAQEIITSAVLEMMSGSDTATVTTDAMQSLMTQMMSGMVSYAQKNGISLDNLSSGNSLFSDYLATDEAQEMMQDWIDENLQVSGNLSLSDEMVDSLSAQLSADYANYAAQNGAMDTGAVTDSFSDYMSSDYATNIMASAVYSMMDTSSLTSSALTDSLTSSLFDTDELSAQMSDAMAEMMEQMIGEMTDQISSAMEDSMDGMGDSLTDAFADTFADMFDIDTDAFTDAFDFNMDSDDLTDLLISMTTAASATYDSNLEAMGYVDFDDPSEIDIYPFDFEAKDAVIDILDAYNDRMNDSGQEDKVLTYSDTVGTLMSSVTEIINLISYVLIAFVSISLVVSSIMIGVITYISVLERRKEIGILRAIGASKGNISQMFSAETGIIGLTAGLLGVGLSELIMIPGNAIIHMVAGNDISMILFFRYGLLLVILSVVLTLIGGLIPSVKAAGSDPVKALRAD